MSVTLPDLEAHLNALGDCTILIGNPFAVGGLGEFGAKEGDVSIAWNASYNNLMFDEATGDSVHAATVKGVNPVITIPTIIANADLWERVSPVGKTSGGWSRRRPAATTSMVIVPTADLLAAEPTGYAYPVGGPWAPAVPVNWVWFWKVYLQLPDFAFRNPDGGKSIGNVIVQAMYYGANPEDHKLFTIGNPRAAATPIAVLI